MDELIELSDDDAPGDLMNVRVLAVPKITPDGAPFTGALALAFGVDVAVAIRIVSSVPVVVKRGVDQRAAEGLCQTLEALGASAEIERVGSPSNPVVRFASPSSAESAPTQEAGPVSLPLRAALPAVRGPDAPGAKPLEIRDHLPRVSLPRGASFVLAFVLLAGVVAGVMTFAKSGKDQAGLGNMPIADSRCAAHDCLADIGETATSQMTLLVVWRDGCLDPATKLFLEGLTIKYPPERLTVLGATSAPSDGSKAVGADWPGADCKISFRVAKPDKGSVQDALPSPAAYLLDGKGRPVGIWKGGMSRPQRIELEIWLEAKL